MKPCMQCDKIMNCEFVIGAPDDACAFFHQKPIKWLGYVNGWGNTPPAEYLEHIRLLEVEHETHDVIGCEIGRCAYSTTCRTCGIKWAVDSSD